MGRMKGDVDDLRLYVLFNNISVISGQWDGDGDGERLCEMEPCLRQREMYLQL